MSLRSFKERIVQTLAFEAGGLVLVTPVYALVFSTSVGGSALLMIAISVAVMIWSPVHNTVFDLVDLRLTGRMASDRPHGLRLAHALSHEASSLVLTLPVLMVLGEHSLSQALLLDLGLTAFYAVYAYGFNILYDRLRPVRRQTTEV